MNLLGNKKSGFQIVLVLAALITGVTSITSQIQSTRALTAPTFYIAASAEYDRYSTDLNLKGVSNLPAGSRLSVSLQDYVGYKSTVLSQDAVVVLAKDGFFEINLKPRQGRRFKENMVCIIDLNPTNTRQDESVLKVVGKKGELLGGSKNPQVGKKSGENFYLWALVHVP